VRRTVFYPGGVLSNGFARAGAQEARVQEDGGRGYEGGRLGDAEPRDAAPGRAASSRGHLTE
jgi:hypothetical protein